MRAHHVHVTYDFTKPPDRVFAHLAEHENLAALFGARIRRLNDGTDGSRNGVGSRRELRVAPLVPPFEETVTEVVPNERIVYRITKGSPLKDHEGRMLFSEGEGGGTRFEYTIRLASPVPGLAAIVKSQLTRSITKSLPEVDRQA
jgi:uncharacterized protein YndB with AHSA1/START domain